jgi:uncharacterized protein (TIGR03067 family)
MKSISIATAFVYGALTAMLPAQQPGEPKADEAKKLQIKIKTRDLKKLQGKWLVVARYSSGQKQKITWDVEVTEPDGKRKILKDQPMIWTFKDNTFNGLTFTMDTSRRPKVLTYDTVNAVNEKVTRHYIYMFDEEQLLLAESDLVLSKGPPAEFSGSLTIMRLDRVKQP